MKKVLFLLSIFILSTMLTISCISVRDKGGKKRSPQRNERSYKKR